jgi:hypothetical protein
MKKAMILIILFTVQLILFGCAGSNKSSIPEAEEKGPIIFSEEGLKGENVAIIYIYRMPAFLGAFVPWEVNLDGEVITNLRQNHYIVRRVPPGTHYVGLDTRPVENIRENVSTDGVRTYYKLRKAYGEERFP